MGFRRGPEIGIVGMDRRGDTGLMLEYEDEAWRDRAAHHFEGLLEPEGDPGAEAFHSQVPGEVVVETPRGLPPGRHRVKVRDV